MSDEKQIVLVTGASGCLGQHIVKHLQEKDDSVQEIRCLDLKPYQNNLQHKNEKPIKIITGDIRNERTVINALEGVNCVIHCAALISKDLFPDEKSLKSVNVEGTQTLIDACIEKDVPYFIYISGVDTVIGDDPIYYGAENTTPIPTKHSLGPNSSTKYEGESIVTKANGTQLPSGKKFITTILRLPLMYGEEDNNFITDILQFTNSRGGILRRIDNIFIKFQPIYAGNAAWACIKTKERLQHDESIGGEAFFISDDTQILDPFDFLEPYLKCRGFHLSKRSYPYWLFMLIFYLFVLFIKLIWPIYPINLPAGLTPQNIRYLCNTFFFNRNKAILRLDYEPIYSHEEAHAKSIPYYQKLYLKK